jgi:hypothetical protein
MSDALIAADYRAQLVRIAAKRAIDKALGSDKSH